MTVTTNFQLAAFNGLEQVNTAATTGDQLAPKILALAGGGFVAAYVNASIGLSGGAMEFFDEFDQLVNAAPVTVNAAHAGTMPSRIALTQLTDGVVVAAWAQLENDGFYHVAYQKFDGSGIAQGTTVVLAGSSATYSDISLAATNDGGFMVSATNGATVVVHGYVGPAGSFGGFGSATLAGSSDSDLAKLNDGNVVISYEHGGNVEYALVDQNGGLIHTATVAAGAGASDVIALGSGGFAIVYEHTGAPGGNGIDIGLSIFDATGNPVGLVDLVNSSDPTSDQHAPALAIDAFGSLIVGWSAPYNGGATQTVLKFFDQSGHAIGPDQTIGLQAGGAGTYEAAIAVANGNDVRVVVVDADTTSTGDGSGTHIHMYSGPSLAVSEGGVGPDTLSALEGILNNVYGGAGDDTIYGKSMVSKYGDYLAGFEGNDTLTAGPNGTAMSGGNGNDILNGGSGYDFLNGDNDDDTIYGGAGSDIEDGGSGNDILVGNADIFASQLDTLKGGDGDDTILGESSDVIEGGAGTDYLYAVNSFDWNIDLGLMSIECLQAAFGNDSISAASQSVGVTIYASGGDDAVIGSGFADMIWAGYGNDTVGAGAGDDVIIGDVGADSLSGGDGNDTIYTDGSDTQIDGGTGNDALYIVGGLGQNLNLATLHFEWVADFSGSNDTLDASGVAVAAVVYGGGGVDTITGGGGADFLWGESGGDTISGGSGDDTLVGGLFGDTLTGGVGTDNIFCNSGGGGDGASDTVKFAAAGWGTDFIYDFEHGVDKINLHGSGATAGTISLGTQGASAVVNFGSDHVIVVGGAATFTIGDIVF